jgi:hypothetical protein
MALIIITYDPAWAELISGEIGFVFESRTDLDVKTV